MAADFDFADNGISVVYYYDQDEHEKIEAFTEELKTWEMKGGSEKPRLKAYSDMVGEKQHFTTDIEMIIDTTTIPLRVRPSMRRVDHRTKHTYLSGSNFLHLFDFAVAVHGRSMPHDTSITELEDRFSSLSLEYQLSTIKRAKSFSRYLDAIN